MFPCSRCWDRVCFCCRPQMDGFIKQEGGAAAEGKEEVERPPDAEADDGTVASAGAGAATGGLTTPPYIHLVFLRSHPQASAQGFLSAFAALQAQGRVDRAKVVRVL